MTDGQKHEEAPRRHDMAGGAQEGSLSLSARRGPGLHIWIWLPGVLALLLLVAIYQEDHAYSRSWSIFALVACVAAVIFVAISVIIFVSKLLRRRSSVVLAMICGAIIAAGIIGAHSSVFLFIDYLKVALFESDYRAIIARETMEGGRRTVLIDWGKSWNNPGSFHILVYDETDEILLPAKSMPATLRQQISARYPTALYGICDLRVTPLRNHFFTAYPVCRQRSNPNFNEDTR